MSLRQLSWTPAAWAGASALAGAGVPFVQLLPMAGLVELPTGQGPPGPEDWLTQSHYLSPQFLHSGLPVPPSAGDTEEPLSSEESHMVKSADQIEHRGKRYRLGSEPRCCSLIVDLGQTGF